MKGSIVNLGSIGGVVGMRPRKETERMFGFFINTVVHRIDVSGAPTYRELLRRVRVEALGVLSHHDVPFEKVVEDQAMVLPHSKPSTRSLLVVACRFPSST